MEYSDPTEVIDISDSDSDTGESVQNTEPIVDSDSLIIIESSDEKESDAWSDSDELGDFSTIMERLELNEEETLPFMNLLRDISSRPEPHAPVATRDSTIVLSSSEDDLSLLPLATKHKSVGSDPPKAPNVSGPTTQKQSNIPSLRAPGLVKTFLTQVRDLKDIDPKLQREVNKLVIDRKATIRDFIVEISFGLQGSTFVVPLTERLAAHDGRVAYFEPPDGVERLIRFRRRHIARYDSPLREWILVEPYERLEDLYIVFMQADQLAQAISEDSLPEMFAALRDHHNLTSRSQTFLIIDGMTAYYKRKGMKKTKRGAIESSLTFLQAVERCFIVHVEGPGDTSQWLFNIACDLGIRPHKRIRDSFLPFCTDTKVKCGSSKEDTYKKMLQQIHGITESAADGIFEQVPTLRLLFEGYEREADIEEGRERLKDVIISNRKDGVAKSRILNQALSRKVYDVMWGQDPLMLVL